MNASIQSLESMVIFKPSMAMIVVNEIPGEQLTVTFDGSDLTLKSSEVVAQLKWANPQVKGEIVSRLTLDMNSVFVAEFNERGDIVRETEIRI